MNYVSELYSLAPGFRSDRDEVWMLHLSTDERSLLNKKRKGFLKLLEANDVCDQEIRRQVRASTDEDEIKKLEARQAKRIQLFRERLQSEAKLLTIEVRQLREKAYEIGQRKYDEEVKAFNKRVKEIAASNYERFMHDEAMDVVEEYMPNYTVTEKPKQKSIPPEPKQQAATNASSLKSSDQSSKGSKALPKAVSDPLVAGTDQDEASILVELRHQINKYNCREEALKAIRSFRRHYSSIRALGMLIKHCENRGQQN